MSWNRLILIMSYEQICLFVEQANVFRPASLTFRLKDEGGVKTEQISLELPNGAPTINISLVAERPLLC